MYHSKKRKLVIKKILQLNHSVNVYPRPKAILLTVTLPQFGIHNATTTLWQLLSNDFSFRYLSDFKPSVNVNLTTVQALYSFKVSVDRIHQFHSY